MKGNTNKKFLSIFLPIIAVVVAVIAIVGGILASDKSKGLDLVPYLEATSGDVENEENASNSGDDTPVISYTLSGCKFSGTATHLFIKKGTHYTVTDCEFSGSTESAVIVGGGLTLQNSSIHDSSSSTDGGGILVDNGGSVTLIGSTIYECEARYGGGVYVEYGSTLNMNGTSSISNNTATNFGGGVYVSNYGTLNMNGTSSISNNTATYSGGGVYVYQYGTLNINGTSSISNNTATDHGGGVYVYHDSELNLGTSEAEWTGEISGNSAELYGGGICVSTATINQYGGKITANKLTSSTASDRQGAGVYITSGIYSMYGTAKVMGNNVEGYEAYYGGGVYVNSNGTFNMNGASTISNNTATNSGGGVYVFHDSKLNLGTSEAEWTGEISGNSANTYGGGIYGSAATINQYGGTISGNKLTNSTTSERQGAGVYMDGVTYSMYGTAKVMGNNEEGYEAYYGGGVFVSSGTLNMNGTSSISNNTANLGGGVYVQSGSTLNMSGSSSILNNTASSTGGGIYSFDELNLGTIEAEWTGKISGNSAVAQGGGIYVFADINQYGGEISGNKLTSSTESERQGAGVYLESGTYSMYGTAEVKGNDVEGYEAYDGGGVFVDAGTLNMNGTSSISNNTAFCGGGVYVYGVYSSNGTLNMNGTSSISNNTATGIGGGVFVGSYGTLNMNGASISNNTAIIGGGIEALSTTITIENSNFNNNTASSAGGGIYCESGELLNISSSNFDGNSAGMSGGAIEVHSSILTITNCNIDGGLDYLAENFDEDLFNAEKGAAIFSSDSQLYLDEVSFSNCRSSLSGGAIYFEDQGNLIVVADQQYSPLRIDRCTFAHCSTISDDNNESEYNAGGGAIYLDSIRPYDDPIEYFRNNEEIINVAEITNTTFIYNRSGNDGGAVYIQNSGYEFGYDAQQYIFDHLRPEFDPISEGVTDPEYYIEPWGSYVNYDNCTFFGNNTARNGGAIFLDPRSFVKISNTTIDGAAAGSGYDFDSTQITDSFDPDNPDSFYQSSELEYQPLGYNAEYGGGIYIHGFVGWYYYDETGYGSFCNANGFYRWEYGNCILTDEVYIKNCAAKIGGGIFNYGQLQFGRKFEGVNSQREKIDLDSDDDVSIFNNHATMLGSGVYSDNNFSIYTRYSSVRDNYSRDYHCYDYGDYYDDHHDSNVALLGGMYVYIDNTLYDYSDITILTTESKTMEDGTAWLGQIQFLDISDYLSIYMYDMNIDIFEVAFEEDGYGFLTGYTRFNQDDSVGIIQDGKIQGYTDMAHSFLLVDLSCSGENEAVAEIINYLIQPCGMANGYDVYHNEEYISYIESTYYGDVEDHLVAYYLLF